MTAASAPRPANDHVRTIAQHATMELNRGCTVGSPGEKRSDVNGWHYERVILAIPPESRQRKKRYKLADALLSLVQIFVDRNLEKPVEGHLATKGNGSPSRGERWPNKTF